MKQKNDLIIKEFRKPQIGMCIVLIGTLTGFLTDYFVGDEKMKAQLNRIEEKLDRLLEK